MLFFSGLLVMVPLRIMISHHSVEYYLNRKTFFLFHSFALLLLAGRQLIAARYKDTVRTGPDLNADPTSNVP